MRHSKAFAGALAFSLLAFSGVAGAQTKADNYSYDFVDDLMTGDTLGSPPPMLTLRRTVPRIMLIRPRASFVGAMLKSVEVL